MGRQESTSRAMKALSTVDRIIYRNLVKIAKNVKNPFFFQQIPSPEEFQRAEGDVPSSLEKYSAWMSGRKGSKVIHPQILDALKFCDTDRDRMMDKDKIISAIRYAFRKALDSTSDHDGEPGFEAIKILSDQVNLSKVTSISSIGPEKVRTICSVVYAGEQNNFDNGNIFFYRITIENLGENDIKVDGRSWRFEGDEEDEVFEISKFHPGLIGLTPTIKPMTSFHYMSNTKIFSKTGTMQGSLHVQNLATKTMFEVDVEKCPLIARAEKGNSSSFTHS